MTRTEVAEVLRDGVIADVRVKRGRRIRRARVRVVKPLVGWSDVLHVVTLDGYQVGRLVARDVVEARPVRPRSLAA